MNYEHAQIDRALAGNILGAEYALKIENRASGAQTKWLHLTARQVLRVRAIFDEPVAGDDS